MVKNFPLVLLLLNFEYEDLHDCPEGSEGSPPVIRIARWLLGCQQLLLLLSIFSEGMPSA
jgi:hypothetical protein